MTVTLSDHHRQICLIFCCIFSIPCKTSLSALQNHPFFSFLLLMDPVCSCCVVSIHFIVFSDLFPTPSPNIILLPLLFFPCVLLSQQYLCFCSSAAFYSLCHLCIHIHYGHEDHLDSVALSDSEIITPQHYTST